MADGNLVVHGLVDDIPPTPVADLEAALVALRAAAPVWTATGAVDRLELLRELMAATLAAAPAWVDAAARAKGDPDDPRLLGEEWSGSIVVALRQLKGLVASLTGVVETGRPRPPDLRVAADGRVVADVLPADWIDRLLLPGFTAEVRLRPEITLAEAEARIGRIYRDGADRRPAVACVLGAGNVSSIPFLDVLHQLFAEDRVVVLKMSPVNAHLGPHLAEALEPLVERGFLRIVYGGAEVASHLVEHDAVDTVHVTGSKQTHDAIVFGEGPDGDRRRREARPRLDKPITSELGAVSPVIVVPGPWRDRDLAYHGDNIASMLVHNAGFNCLAARIIVQHRAWAKRRPLLDAVRDSLRRAEPREPYYPGARERWERFTTAYRSAEWFGSDDDGHVPFTLIPELDPDDRDQLAFTTEPFCGLFGEVGLDAERSVEGFLDAAVDLCNSRLAGSLAASIIVHPASMRDPNVATAVERAIDTLEYGTVVVNHWPGVAFGLASTSWGAFPGSTLADVGSGIGVVHNSYLLEDVEKAVVRGPFRTPYTPGWFHTNRRAHELWRGAAHITATADASRVPALLWHSARG